MLAKDFPIAPLWYPKTTVAFSDKVTDVKVDAFEQLDLVGDQGEVIDETCNRR